MKKYLLFLFTSFAATVSCYAQSLELDRLKASLPTLKEGPGYVDVLNRMAMLLYEKNIDSTFYYTVKAREIANKLQYEKGKADATNNLGIFFDIKGNLQLALRYYDEANLAYTKLNDSTNRIQTLMNIAMVYKQMGKDQRAIQRFNGALNLGKKLSKDSIMSLALYNYVLQFPTQFSKEVNNQYINKAKQIASKYKDDRTLLAIDQLIADEMISNGKRDEGLALLQQAIDKAIEKKLYYVSMDIFIDMGDQLMSDDPTRAVAYYQQALDLANKNTYLIYSKLLTRKLFDFYSSRYNSAKANEYATQLIDITDEQEKLNNQSGIDYLDYVLKDQQVNALLIDPNYQNALLILLVVICLMAVVMIISIRQNLRRTKKLNKLISKQNIAMKRTLHALEQSQADNTRMMKIAAHDLRNPIGGIYSLMSLMLAEPDRSADDIEILQTIKTSAQNSLDLVNDLLEAQFNTENFKKEPIDISEILQYCVSLLLNKAEAKHQQLKLQSEELIIPANREKLWRVISNLISNAIKFSPSGAKIDVKMETDADSVLIKVRDEGIGIPPEMHDKIFDMFTQAKRPGTDGEQAFGLGLAICKQIVEGHGGKIWFESKPDKGTTFYVRLPTV
ncbi:ATP-binding protein [Pedobacter sp. UC225_65]|uniref:ATP-binding protein n=1 Tax=Pedobacter sp. UC225_65 TaxID=3350173 RepID=UPI00366B315D